MLTKTHFRSLRFKDINKTSFRPLQMSLCQLGLSPALLAHAHFRRLKDLLIWPPQRCPMQMRFNDVVEMFLPSHINS